VPSIEMALRELELQPLHDALRAGDEQAALAEVAALLEVEPREAPPAPNVERRITKADDRTLARAVEKLVDSSKPEMSKGKWIYDWLIGNVWPEADLMALWLDVGSQSKSARANSLAPGRLLADERFRRAIGVNEHDGVAYFNRERFADAVEWLAVPDEASLVAAARKSEYRLDDLSALLEGQPDGSSISQASGVATKPASQSSTARAAPPPTKPNPDGS
jgi:hypothetical protein